LLIDDGAFGAFAGESRGNRASARVPGAGDQDDFVFESHAQIQICL
jgi:hypothetical protein